MRMHSRRIALFIALFAILSSTPAHAQIAASRNAGQRGFIEGTAFLFPQDTSIDGTNLVGDLLVRDEGFVKPAQWLQFAAGFDLRANTHDQVENEWRLDFRDRGELRPRLSVRR